MYKVLSSVCLWLLSPVKQSEHTISMKIFSSGGAAEPITCEHTHIDIIFRNTGLSIHKSICGYGPLKT